MNHTISLALKLNPWHIRLRQISEINYLNHILNGTLAFFSCSDFVQIKKVNTPSKYN